MKRWICLALCLCGCQQSQRQQADRIIDEARRQLTLEQMGIHPHEAAPPKQQRAMRTTTTQPAALVVTPTGVQTLTITTTNVANPRLRYDLNGDGKVDILDMILVRSCLGWTTANPEDAGRRNWCVTYDVNVDWKVDVLDMVIVSNNMDGR